MPSGQAETRYPMGQTAPMVRLLQRRTPQDSASFLLPHLFDTMSLLDIGCGPGNITAGFKKLHPNATVVGADADAGIINCAKERYEGTGVTFLMAEILDLPFDNGSFDVVYSHNIFQYIEDVPRALAEIRRVLRHGGVLATRQVAYRQLISGPVDMTTFKEAYSKFVEAESGGNSNVGEVISLRALEAGFRRVTPDASFYVNVGERRRNLAEDWLGMMCDEGMGKRMIELGVIDEGEFKEVVRQWELVRDCDAGFVMSPNLEMLAWK